MVRDFHNTNVGFVFLGVVFTLNKTDCMIMKDYFLIRANEKLAFLKRPIKSHKPISRYHRRTNDKPSGCRPPDPNCLFLV